MICRMSISTVSGGGPVRSLISLITMFVSISLFVSGSPLRYRGGDAPFAERDLVRRERRPDFFLLLGPFAFRVWLRVTGTLAFVRPPAVFLRTKILVFLGIVFVTVLKKMCTH